MKSVASKAYWSNHWQKTNFEIAPTNHPVRQWIEKEIASTRGASCLEIGCYPGKFLAVFGKKGYALHGIDSFVGTESLLSTWLRNSGYKVGTFYQSDFLHFKTPDLYDVVCSFGFIEHFKYWQGILSKHVELTKTGGNIIVEVPNLKSPLYHLLYKLLEPKVLENHEMSAMDLEAICNVLEKEGCKIQAADYIGIFYFRFVTKHNKLPTIIASFINFFRPLFQLLPSCIYARYIGVIAVKK